MKEAGLRFQLSFRYCSQRSLKSIRFKTLPGKEGRSDRTPPPGFKGKQVLVIRNKHAPFEAD